MPSLEEFRTLIGGNEDSKLQAMRDYAVNIDPGLDGDTTVPQPVRKQEITFVFELPNIIRMRAKEPNDEKFKEIWYLPWYQGGASKASLDGEGPGFFSTSQLDGCRFTIKYDDESRKKVTVLHLSGLLSSQENHKTLSPARDAVERTEFGLQPTDPLPRGVLVRRYSSAKIPFYKSASRGAEVKAKLLADSSATLYEGNKASIWGVRGKSGRWYFYAQDIFTMSGSDEGLGIQRLSKT